MPKANLKKNEPFDWACMVLTVNDQFRIVSCWFMGVNWVCGPVCCLSGVLEETKVVDGLETTEDERGSQELWEPLLREPANEWDDSDDWEARWVVDQGQCGRVKETGVRAGEDILAQQQMPRVCSLQGFVDCAHSGNHDRVSSSRAFKSQSLSTSELYNPLYSVICVLDVASKQNLQSRVLFCIKRTVAPLLLHPKNRGLARMRVIYIGSTNIVSLYIVNTVRSESHDTKYTRHW